MKPLPEQRERALLSSHLGRLGGAAEHGEELIGRAHQRRDHRLVWRLTRGQRRSAVANQQVGVGRRRRWFAVRKRELLSRRPGRFDHLPGQGQRQHRIEPHAGGVELVKREARAAVIGR